MPVGESELSYADKSVHFTARLVSEFGGGFAESHGQIAVTL